MRVGKMLYEYKCDKCEKKFDVIKPHTEHRRVEKCEACGDVSRRLFSASELNIDKMQPEYYHAFKEVVKTRRHRTELIKKHGVTEIGNEKPKNMHENFKRQRDQRRNQTWNEV